MNKIKTLWATLIVVIGVVFDQWTKHLIYTAALKGEIPFKVTSFFDLIAVFNTGVSFSILSSSSSWMHLALVGVAILTSIVLFYWLIKEPSFMMKSGFSLIIAGALGNALDRLQHGAVLDFLYFHYSSWGFPAFNGADVLINIGVIIVLAHLFLFKHKKSRS